MEQVRGRRRLKLTLRCRVADFFCPNQSSVRLSIAGILLPKFPSASAFQLTACTSGSGMKGSGYLIESPYPLTCIKPPNPAVRGPQTMAAPVRQWPQTGALSEIRELIVESRLTPLFRGQRQTGAMQNSAWVTAEKAAPKEWCTRSRHSMSSAPASRTSARRSGARKPQQMPGSWSVGGDECVESHRFHSP